ncbi:MAG: serine/threonine-protein kinase, partial [Muribaculaceae bacterium]|nr:serine/threonine-protein kinase [Muribaculaceae bacterium]
MSDPNINSDKTKQDAVDTKWTEIEHLPEWDEEYYDVYTAKKYGKWVMLKTLKPEFRDKPEFQAMIEKEFEVRYNLASPHIVMINDYENVPGVGMSIITDDVYGDSLRKLISEKKVTPANIDKLRHQLVDAMEYIQNNPLVHHPIRPESI